MEGVPYTVARETINPDHQSAYPLLFLNVIHFKDAARLVESEVSRYRADQGLQHTEDPLESFPNKDYWMSAKAVSHFNLGTALELMMKLVLVINGTPVGQTHSLLALHNSLSSKWKRRMQEMFSKAEKNHGLLKFVRIRRSDAADLPDPGDDRDVIGLRGTLAYLDDDAVLSKARYLWKHMSEGKWLYYLDDITILTDLIDQVLAKLVAENQIPGLTVGKQD